MSGVLRSTDRANRSHWRATLVSAVALPLSILPAFGFMALAGCSLNTLTLLSLVVGILADDVRVGGGLSRWRWHQTGAKVNLP